MIGGIRLRDVYQASDREAAGEALRALDQVGVVEHAGVLHQHGVVDSIPKHLVDQRLRKKARGFRQSELDRSATAFFHALEERLIFVRRVILVELPAQGRNHDCEARVPSPAD